ncbi:MAG: hypothetical protein KBS78_06305 [Bacteroidales bacterium]|nr:hypothetical protein [Candidatus Cryptobacteroides faecihippi]
MQTAYPAFEKAMDEECVYRNPDLTFSEICLAIGADEGQLDSLLKCELGYSGEELLEAYRKHLIETL